MTLRPGLRWGLGATVVMTGAALWWPQQESRLVAAVQPLVPEPATATTAPEPRRVVAAPAPPLPADLPSWSLEPARRDPFAAVQPPAPPAPPPPPAPRPFVGPPAPPPPPAPPALQVRYLGSMVTPEGVRVVMLARGDAAITVQQGTRLDEGYVVESLGQDSVRLVYPPSGTVVDVPINPSWLAGR